MRAVSIVVAVFVVFAVWYFWDQRPSSRRSYQYESEYTYETRYSIPSRTFERDYPDRAIYRTWEEPRRRYYDPPPRRSRRRAPPPCDWDCDD